MACFRRRRRLLGCWLYPGSYLDDDFGSLVGLLRTALVYIIELVLFLGVLLPPFALKLLNLLIIVVCGLILSIRE